MQSSCVAMGCERYDYHDLIHIETFRCCVQHVPKPFRCSKTYTLFLGSCSCGKGGNGVAQLLASNSVIPHQVRLGLFVETPNSPSIRTLEHDKVIVSLYNIASSISGVRQSMINVIEGLIFLIVIISGPVICNITGATDRNTIG